MSICGGYAAKTEQEQEREKGKGNGIVQPACQKLPGQALNPGRQVL